MDFFLETHNGECGLGEHFCDQVRCHCTSVLMQSSLQHLISWSHPETVSTQAEPRIKTKTKTQEEELNKESALS